MANGLELFVHVFDQAERFCDARLEVALEYMVLGHDGASFRRDDFQATLAHERVVHVIELRARAERKRFGEVNHHARTVLQPGDAADCTDTVTSQHNALMGQRRLEIIPSKTGEIMPENHVFQGHFEPGIAETLRLIVNVNSQLEAVQKTILLISQGDSTHKSATEIYEDAMRSVEDIFAHTEKTVGSFGPKLNKLFKQMNTSTKALSKTALQADTAIKTVTAAANEKISLVDSVIISLSANAQKTNDIITNIEKGIDNETLLQSKELIENINKFINGLNKAIMAIDTKNIGIKDENGNEVHLISWKNMNIIGDNARDKARKRLEDAKAQQEQNKAGK